MFSKCSGSSTRQLRSLGLSSCAEFFRCVVTSSLVSSTGCTEMEAKPSWAINQMERWWNMASECLVLATEHLVVEERQWKGSNDRRRTLGNMYITSGLVGIRQTNLGWSRVSIGTSAWTLTIVLYPEAYMICRKEACLSSNLTTESSICRTNTHFRLRTVTTDAIFPIVVTTSLYTTEVLVEYLLGWDILFSILFHVLTWSQIESIYNFWSPRDRRTSSLSPNILASD